MRRVSSPTFSARSGLRGQLPPNSMGSSHRPYLPQLDPMRKTCLALAGERYDRCSSRMVWNERSQCKRICRSATLKQLSRWFARRRSKCAYSHWQYSGYPQLIPQHNLQQIVARKQTPNPYLKNLNAFPKTWGLPKKLKRRTRIILYNKGFYQLFRLPPVDRSRQSEKLGAPDDERKGDV